MGQAGSLVITHIFAVGNGWPLALKGPWILAGGAAQRNHRNWGRSTRTPVGVLDVTGKPERLAPLAQVPRPGQGAKAILTGFPVVPLRFTTG